MREYSFSVTRTLPYEAESAIISLYVKIWVSENPYSRVFHTMHITNNNINPYLPHFLP